MAYEVTVVVPFHKGRAKFLEKCLASLRESRKVCLEIVAFDDNADEDCKTVARKYADSILLGSGYQNYRPGSIHLPVFSAFIASRAPFVTYLFSDDQVSPNRYWKQVSAMKHGNYAACFCNTLVVNQDGEVLRKVIPDPSNMRWGGICTYTEALMFDRRKLENVGGLDYPIHAAAQAEAWLWASAGAAGKTCYINEDGLLFTEHPESITNDGKNRYKEAVRETGMTEERHWELWGRVEPTFQALVRKAVENDQR